MNIENPQPAKDRLRLNEDEGATPTGPQPGEKGPQKSIGCPKGDAPSTVLALEDQELVAQGEHLGLKRRPAAEQGSKRCDGSQKSGNHRRRSLDPVP